jgi:hypothetical protein
MSPALPSFSSHLISSSPKTAKTQETEKTLTLPLCSTHQIDLIPDQNTADVRVGVRADIGEPGAHGVEGAAGGDVVDKEAAWHRVVALVYVRVLVKKRKRDSKDSREGG